MPRLRAALAALILFALGGCATSPPEHVSYQRRPVSFSAAGARDWLTQYRRSQGLTPVSLDGRLTAFAQAQADAMASHDELSHSVGGSFSSRVQSAGLADARIAENVSYGTYTDGDAMRQWKNSPGHNANLLMPNATRFGIAIAQSRGRVYWAMAIAGEPAKAQPSPFGEGPMVRVRRRVVSPARSVGGVIAAPFGGLFGN
ncbi:CAP domain-containing protein [Labrys monachus]|uniref:Uncharacterized protein YkwD n=1 Tax=Labrys monachus TaxID=217067 RepID=A0ABU0FPM0_9HYPH|nr:CAP domain-containing protein [Labrys monachus]MDQ0396317.1 uncharacterized protein YkwD [Labrys monachus]